MKEKDLCLVCKRYDTYWECRRTICPKCAVDDLHKGYIPKNPFWKIYIFWFRVRAKMRAKHER